MIVVNNLREEGAGFDIDTNKVTIIDRKGNVSEIPLMSKIGVAEKILDKVIEFKRGV